MKIGVVTANINFSSYIMDEMKKHHEVSLWHWTPKMGTKEYRPSVEAFIDTVDLIYSEFIQLPLPHITQYLSAHPEKIKPIVARMDGLDLYSHKYVDWRRVNALIIPPVQYDRLIESRKYIEANRKLVPLPEIIVKTNIGIDTEMFQPDHQRTPTYNIVVHAYMLREVKRIYTAIQIFYDLIAKDGDKPWRLILIGGYDGSGEYGTIIQELIQEYRFPLNRLGIIPKNLPRQEWVNFIRQQDIYWAASVKESFGVSVAEAAASGVHPIVNCWRGVRYLYPKEVITRSPAEMVEATIRWGNLSDGEKIKNRAHVRSIVEQWDAKKTAVGIREICEEVMANE